MDPINGIKQIGFAAFVAVLLLIAIGVALKRLLIYFTTRLDKKDADLMRVVDDRQRDLMRTEQIIDANTRGQERIVEALTELADEIRHRRR